jgi:hypothetical protein
MHKDIQLMTTDESIKGSKVYTGQKGVAN